MRRLAPALILLLGGCSLAQFYFEQTEGISPAKLISLYFQEKQYVHDRAQVAKVKGALAAEPALLGADIAVDAYRGEVMLTGNSAEQARTAVRRYLARRAPRRRRPHSTLSGHCVGRTLRPLLTQRRWATNRTHRCAIRGGRPS